MSFRFAAGWAHVLVALGITAIVVGVLLAGVLTAMPFPWTNQKLGTMERVAVGVTAIAVGVAIGGSLITLGQLVLAFLDVREHLQRLTQRLASDDDVPCRYCGEHIKPDAAVCRYCRGDLARPTAADRLLTPR
jgi:hypothetical protein